MFCFGTQSSASASPVPASDEAPTTTTTSTTTIKMTTSSTTLANTFSVKKHIVKLFSPAQAHAPSFTFLSAAGHSPYSPATTSLLTRLPAADACFPDAYNAVIWTLGRAPSSPEALLLALRHEPAVAISPRALQQLLASDESHAGLFLRAPPSALLAAYWTCRLRSALVDDVQLRLARAKIAIGAAVLAWAKKGTVGKAWVAQGYDFGNKRDEYIRLWYDAEVDAQANPKRSGREVGEACAAYQNLLQVLARAEEELRTAEDRFEQAEDEDDGALCTTLTGHGVARGLGRDLTAREQAVVMVAVAGGIKAANRGEFEYFEHVRGTTC